MMTSPKLEKTDLSSLVGIGSGAAYLPPTLSEKFARTLKIPPIGEGNYHSSCPILASNTDYNVQVMACLKQFVLYNKLLLDFD